jgi:type IV pilus assembly protein PilB
MENTQLKSIEDILFADKKINADQLSAIKIESANTGDRVESIIKQRGLVSDLDLAKAKAKTLGSDYIDLSQITIPTEVLDQVSQESAKKYLVVPFDLKNGTLYLAMSDPLDLPTIELIERKSGLKVKPFLALDEDLQKAIVSQYGKSIGRDISEALSDIDDSTTKLEENIKDVDQVEGIVQDSSVARVVSIILEYAVKVGASDIHIEPGEKMTRVRYRIDGVMQEKLSKIPKASQDSIVARIKILANLKIDEKRKPQDGRFPIEIAKQRIDLRISTLPTVHGEKVVIRLLKDQSAVLKLNDLGLRGAALKDFERGLLKPNGIILVTGPTGSGKTVTLATALHKINSVRVNIMTLEDPVEIRVPGVNQVQVNNQAGLTFAKGLRSFLRQDPDIIMVGEIRDGETANLAVQAALTGHLVLATLHTSSSAGSMPRLLDMGVESFLLSSTANAILAQRLVRRICPYCKEKFDAPETAVSDIKKSLGGLFSKELVDINSSVPISAEGASSSKTKDANAAFEAKISDIDFKTTASPASVSKFNLYRGRGCDKCGNTGYSGRIGMFEVLDVTEPIGSLITKKATSDEIEKLAVENGMITLLQDGYIKALEGFTTLEEVLRVADG